MKFLAVKGNPYTVVGPSGKVYRFYTRVEQPVEVTDPGDIAWAKSKSVDSDTYLQSLRVYEDVIQEMAVTNKRVNLFDNHPLTTPALAESFPVERPTLGVSEEETTSVVEDESTPSSEEEEVWFEELSPDDLNLSVRKFILKTEDFLTADVGLTNSQKKEYIEELTASDTRITLHAELDELLSKVEDSSTCKSLD